MVTLYYTPRCVSCRKAKKWFEDHEIPIKEHNLYTHPLTKEELLRILQMTEEGTDEIISTRSVTIRQLDINLNQLSLSALYDLINQHPCLLKKPIILDEKRLQVGYNKDEIVRFLPRKRREYNPAEMIQA
ncbi:transcriptional regulator Spx [Bacillus benzoevorans]|uniref:Regulatory protein spx n=1 Tax=Bacillus benzoevorans TaxID=1456 RepID=A0A7X0HWF6_9BACI|nr:transcriptional regulator Spx [Bacillus benzoevorans]MBB6446856.1 regulatory protein spx [Bacillus benzoevorans]